MVLAAVGFEAEIIGQILRTFVMLRRLPRQQRPRWHEHQYGGDGC